MKRQPVLGDFDPDRYETYRLWATSADDTRVPISVVHRKDIARDGANPTLLYGYGSYEISIDPTFSSMRLSLLDRGFVFAIAHVRGGGEMGRRWYENGKYEHKTNTFLDTIASAEAMIDAQLTSPAKLALRGGSAGGLLVGATVNMPPDLFAAAVAEVPFVDVLTTMLDDTIPLTVIEWEQWGNPVRRPRRLQAAGGVLAIRQRPRRRLPRDVHHRWPERPRVGYWEPAKWAAKLRSMTTGTRPILLKMRLGAGHCRPVRPIRGVARGSRGLRLPHQPAHVT